MVSKSSLMLSRAPRMFAETCPSTLPPTSRRSMLSSTSSASTYSPMRTDALTVPRWIFHAESKVRRAPPRVTPCHSAPAKSTRTSPGWAPDGIRAEIF